MKEVEFRDRVPTHPGRVRLVPVSGNLYDMERADDPTETGTALNKVAFDSIVKSRLTGRYYDTIVAREVATSLTGLTANPLPTNGWVLDGTKLQAASGGYTVKVNGSYSSYTPVMALDGDLDTEYRSDALGEIIFQIAFPSAIKVKKYKIAMRASNYTYNVTTEFQGSNDGINWTTLFTTTDKPDDLTEYTLTRPGEYTQYRLKFAAVETGIILYEFRISDYDISTYKNAFTIAEGVPTNWTVGQRLMISTPAVFESLAVVANTLNGITVNTILQPNKRYELRYTGSAFAAKEV